MLAGCGSGHRVPPTTSGASSVAGTTGSGTSSKPGPPTSPRPPRPTVVNSPTCRPPAQHPYPVVLLPGTYGVSTWQLIGPRLASLGYCVHTLSYGHSET